MKIVFLDSGNINPGDISWQSFEKLGEFLNYSITPVEKLAERIKEAEALFIDSIDIDRELMLCAPKLKFIGLSATGFDNVDIEAAAELGIAVSNVPTYATEAVAQHVMALLLSLTNQIQAYNELVIEGKWRKDDGTNYVPAPMMLLEGKSMGIVGYGNIGQKIGKMAEAFGMKINVYSRDREAAINSDVVSLSCPLTKENVGMVNSEFIREMKDGAILINAARGALVDETALAEALKSGKIAGAGMDVLAEEPPSSDNPLIGLKNCFISPHVAIMPIETRMRVVETCADNLKSYIEGGVLNRLV